MLRFLYLRLLTTILTNDMNHQMALGVILRMMALVQIMNGCGSMVPGTISPEMRWRLMVGTTTTTVMTTTLIRMVTI